MKFPKLDEKQERLDAKRAELQKIFEQAGDGGEGTLDLSKVTCVDGDSQAKVDRIRELNAEIDDLAQEVEGLQDVKSAATNLPDDDESGKAEPGAPSRKPEGLKSIGEQFVDSEVFKSWQPSTDSRMVKADVDLKTLFQTSAGWDPEETRSGRVVLDAQRPIQVTDLIPRINIDQSAYVYMEETTFTNNAAETAEGGTYGEAALALTEQTSNVRKITVWLPVTDEQLSDEAGARNYINQRLPFMLRQRLDGQILTGDGVAPNLEGVNNVTGIQTQAKGTDPTPDAVYKAMTKVDVTGRAMPSAVVFHPNDWQEVRLLRTSEGIYIWGSPSESGPERIWGLPVVKSDAQTENTAVVGDWENYSLLAVRQGINVQVSNSHSTFFVEGKQAIRADMRAALVFLRPAAFCTVSGL